MSIFSIVSICICLFFASCNNLSFPSSKQSKEARYVFGSVGFSVGFVKNYEWIFLMEFCPDVVRHGLGRKWLDFSDGPLPYLILEYYP